MTFKREDLIRMGYAFFISVLSWQVTQVWWQSVTLCAGIILGVNAAAFFLADSSEEELRKKLEREDRICRKDDD